MLIQHGNNGQLTPVQGGITYAIDALIGFQLHGDKIAAGTGHYGTRVYYFHVLVVLPVFSKGIAMKPLAISQNYISAVKPGSDDLYQGKYAEMVIR
jgi:hypothetical protein